MKGSTFSSSGELSESQGLNDFLNAHNIKDEAKALNKNRPEPTFLQSMNPRHNDLVGYYPQQPSYGNYPGSVNPNGQYYGYEDEEFDEYGEEGYAEYEEERDPYDFEVDLAPTKKRNADKGAKVLDKSYEERKKALQKKKDAKKKAKDEENKKKEEEEKRKKIELAMQNEKKTKQKSQVNEVKNIQKSEKKPAEKISFDIADALNESQSSHSKSDYADPKPEIYDPTVMLQYMGKSQLSQPSQSQSQVANVNNRTEEEDFSNRNNIEENIKLQGDVYDAHQTNQYLRKSIEFDESERKNQESERENIEKNMPKLPITAPTGGLDGLMKVNSDRFEEKKEKSEQKIDTNDGLKFNNKQIFQESGVKQDSFHSFAPENSLNVANKSPEMLSNFNKTPEIPSSFYKANENPTGIIRNNETLNSSFQKTNEIPSNFNKPNESLTGLNKVSEPVFNIPTKPAYSRELAIKSEELEAALKRNEAYQTEIEALVQQLEFSERKVVELEIENKNLKFSSDSKLRFLQEKNIFLDKMNETKLKNEMNEQFIFEKEGLQLEVEKLKGELAYYQAQNEQKLEHLREIKSLNQKKQNLEEEVKRLKKELLEYQDLTKDPIIQRRALRKKEKFERIIENNEEDEEDFQREFEFQELLIKGYQKENEKNVYELRTLRKELEEMTEKVFEREKVIGNLKAKFAKDSKGFLMMENEPNIDFLKGVSSPEVLISGNEIKELRERLLKLQEEIKLLKDEKFKIKKDYDDKMALLEEEMRKLEEKIKIYDKEKQENDEKIKDFSNQRKQFEDQHNILEHRIKEFEKKFEEAEKREENLKNQINGFKAKKLLEGNQVIEEFEEITQSKQKKIIPNKILKTNEKLSGNKVSKKPMGKTNLKPENKTSKPIKNLIEHNEKSEILKSQSLFSKENKPLNFESPLENIAETQILKENSIPLSKFLIFLESSSLLIIYRIYSSLRELDLPPENSDELKTLLDEIFNKTREFQEIFKEFQQEIEEFLLENRALGRIDALSLRKAFERGVFSLILSGKFDRNKEVSSLRNPLRNNYTKNEINLHEKSEQWKKIENENQSLKELLSNMPKNPTRIDFEIVEKKLEYIERNYRQKELEINLTLENIKNPNRNTTENQTLRLELISVRNQYEREKREYEDILKRKNREIDIFRQELDDLLKEIELLRN